MARFSIKTWFCAHRDAVWAWVTLAALVLLFIVLPIRFWSNEQNGAAAVEQLDGKVVWDGGWYENVPVWNWGTIARVELTRVPITDEEFEKLTPALLRLRNLHGIQLFGTDISDNSLPLVAKLRDVKSVDLRLTRVTQAGIDNFAKFRPDVVITWFPPDDERAVKKEK